MRELAVTLREMALLEAHMLTILIDVDPSYRMICNRLVAHQMCKGALPVSETRQVVE